jgi:hypothetical protein
MTDRRLSVAELVMAEAIDYAWWVFDFFSGLAMDSAIGIPYIEYILITCSHTEFLLVQSPTRRSSDTDIDFDRDLCLPARHKL